MNFNILIVVTFICHCNCIKFDEALYVNNLNSAILFHFDFSTITNDIKSDQFPKAIADIVKKHNLDEAHFTVSRGFWDTLKWGIQPEYLPSQAAEIYAWIYSNPQEVDGKWESLLYTLSGLFCTSINKLATRKEHISPHWSYRPKGLIHKNSSYLKLGVLSAEPLCTENWSPWIKLLPCQKWGGLAQLLNPSRMLYSHFLAIKTSIFRICLDSDHVPATGNSNVNCKTIGWKLHQSISFVLDRVIMGNIHNTWNLNQLLSFDSHHIEKCLLASSSRLIIGPGLSLDNKDEGLKTIDLMSNKSDDKIDLSKYHGHWKVFDQESSFLLAHSSPMIIEKQATGSGNVESGIKSVIVNQMKEGDAIPLVYLDLLSWYFKMKLHTLTVSINGSKMQLVNYNNTTPLENHVRVFYKASVKRVRPAHLELKLLVPPRSTVVISYTFKKELQNWNEYPPDANHEFNICPSIMTFQLPLNYTLFENSPRHFIQDSKSHHHRIIRLYSPLVLVPMPSPDFSMPFNALCLACTALAMVIGSVHKFTTSSIVPVLPSNIKKSLMTRIKTFFSRKIKNE